MVVPRGTTQIFRTGAAEFPRGRRGTSARAPRNFRAGAELPRGRARIFRADGHESSVRFENGRNQKANNAKRSRYTPQVSFEISL